jgi:hypothetical protein
MDIRDTIVRAAQAREAQGYFKRAEAGDKKASALFVRLTAYDVNPLGKSDSVGCLRKTGGGTNVDGYAEDAVVVGSDPSNRMNVLDLVASAGAPGASIATDLDYKERRASDVWEKPKPLSDADMAYLLDGEMPSFEAGGGAPQPPATPTYPSYEALGGDSGGVAITRQLEADYKRAGRPGLDGDCGAWQQRVSYDFLTGVCKTVQESIDKHKAEWCAALGIPVQ